MPNLDYNFINDYSSLSLVNVPLCVINYYTNTNTTTCYCGDIGRVKCYPIFTNLPPQLNFIENWGYYIDYGDGTITTELTGIHSYKVPGTYNITLVVSDSGNNFYKSAYIPKIEAYNFIPDKLTFTYLSGNTVPSSGLIPLLITRSNSYQVHSALSSVGYSVNLSVSGNRSRFQNESSYNADQYAHLKLLSMFTLSGDISPITKIKTTSDDIYAQFNPLTNTIITVPKGNSGIPGLELFFVGTSGTATVNYYEDFKP